MNNAGINIRGDVELMSVDNYKKVAEVNVFGTIRMTKACLPLVRLAKGKLYDLCDHVAIHVGHLTGTSGKCLVHFLVYRTMSGTFAYQT